MDNSCLKIAFVASHAKTTQQTVAFVEGGKGKQVDNLIFAVRLIGAHGSLRWCYKGCPHRPARVTSHSYIIEKQNNANFAPTVLCRRLF